MKRTKKIIATLLAMLTIGTNAMAQGSFETHDYGTFKLHVYYSNDVMADASYIIEGKDQLITLEQPLFKNNVQQYDEYLAKLGKPVEVRITDYHLGGTGNNEIVMAEGMSKFVDEGAYAAMMKGFAQSFGDKIVALPTGKRTKIPFNSTQTWNGITFEFRHGSTSDFPAASILIGKRVYFTHWAPSKSHMSYLQLSSPKAIDAELTETKKAIKSGATLFIGGHGGANDKTAAQFKIDYLKTLKKLMKQNRTPQALADAMRKTYPNLPGAEGLEQLTKTLYAK